MANIFKEFINSKRVTLIRDGEKTLIACDCVESEKHQFVAEATQYEIENGSDICDHIINRGKTLTIEGIVSDDPITIFDTSILSRTVSSITPSLIRSKLSYGTSGDSGKPSKEAFDRFEEIYDRKIIIVLITGLKKYDNMVMEELIIPRTSATVRSLKFTATFRQVNIVSSIMETAPDISQDVTLGAQSKKNIGAQGTEVDIEDKGGSIAHSMFF